MSKEEIELKDGIPADLSDKYDDYFKADDTDIDDGSDDDITPQDIDGDDLDDNTDDTVTEVDEDDYDFSVLGWDEDTIEKIKEINPALLEDLRGLIDAPRKEVDEDAEASDQVTGDITSDKVTVDEETLKTLREKDPAMAGVLESLMTQVNSMSDTIVSVRAEEQRRQKESFEREAVSNFRLINSRMDELAEDFPLLGSYDKLPKNADGIPDERNRSVKERAKLWEKANALYGTGAYLTFKDAVDDSLLLYEGKHAKDRATREVIKDLNQRKKQFTARPTNKATKKKKTTPGSEAHKIDVITEAYKAAGVE
jgi:hypothetical protein